MSISNQNMRRRAKRETRKWVEYLARFGYSAKGIVYILIGILAFMSALNWGGKITGTEGAFVTIASQPFGKFLLFLMAIGLFGYVIWQFVRAFVDPEHDGHDASDWVRRASYFASGLVYGSSAILALRKVFRSSSSGSSGGSSGGIAALLSQPFGQWLVGVVAATTVAYGFYCFYRAYSTKFRQHLKLHQMSIREEKMAIRVARFGLSAKGVVSIIAGYFFSQAARFSDPSKAETTEGALEAIQQQPFGAWLLGLAALGLVAYGLHLQVKARYRRISP